MKLYSPPRAAAALVAGGATALVLFMLTTGIASLLWLGVYCALLATLLSANLKTTLQSQHDSASTWRHRLLLGWSVNELPSSDQSGDAERDNKYLEERFKRGVFPPEWGPLKHCYNCGRVIFNTRPNTNYGWYAPSGSDWRQAYWCFSDNLQEHDPYPADAIARLLVEARDDE